MEVTSVVAEHLEQCFDLMPAAVQVAALSIVKEVEKSCPRTVQYSLEHTEHFAFAVQVAVPPL